jgi:hypothetical protein
MKTINYKHGLMLPCVLQVTIVACPTVPISVSGTFDVH